MKRSLLSALLVAVFATVAVAQIPDIIWYDFNLADATNSASGTVGNGVASATLAWPNPGGLACGDTACATTVAGSGSKIDTGWTTNLGTGDWTVGMHFLQAFPASTTLSYVFGNSTATSFRCFTGGVANPGNIILRGPIADTRITGGGPNNVPVHVCWVYDSSVPETRGYLNGVLNISVPQAALNINGTGNFTVMGYSTSSIAANTIVDDFRFYGRAIDLGGVGPGSEMDLWVNQCSSGPGCLGSFTKYGAGCVGTNGTPTLGGTGCPIAGNTITIDINLALGGAPSLFLLGLGNASVPLNPLCNLQIMPLTPPSIFLTMPPAGSISIPAVLPAATPSGFDVYVQTLIGDAVNPNGIASTNPLKIHFG